MAEEDRCTICLEDKKKPKALPCGHTFCKVCVRKLKLYSLTLWYLRKCPLCRSTAEQWFDSNHAGPSRRNHSFQVGSFWERFRINMREQNESMRAYRIASVLDAARIDLPDLFSNTEIQNERVRTDEIAEVENINLVVEGIEQPVENNTSQVELQATSSSQVNNELQVNESQEELNAESSVSNDSDSSENLNAFICELAYNADSEISEVSQVNNELQVNESEEELNAESSVSNDSDGSENLNAFSDDFDDSFLSLGFRGFPDS